MNEYVEELVFFKEGSFDDKLFYIFRNGAGELRITEAAHYSFSEIQTGMVFRAVIRKKGCAGREIISLMPSELKE